MSRLTRRRFIGLAAAGAGAGTLGVAGWIRRRPRVTVEPSVAVAAAVATTSTPAPTPTPLPEPPVMPRGREAVRLMAGTEWEATGTIFHSGVGGPRVMVLGGVHGNEPGGWLAGAELAQWEVDRGMLIVLPRINWRAADAFVRTLDEAGDLNRLYPGDPEGLPMSRMAAEITALAKQWRPHWLWDMHESWGFYSERGTNSGTAFIGQTVTTADVTKIEDVRRIVDSVNAQIADREQLMMRSRPGGVFRNDGLSPTPTPNPDGSIPQRGRGRSSLSMGTHVPGVSAVLVEMGQMDQAESRRAELHVMLVRTLLQDLGAITLA